MNELAKLMIQSGVLSKEQVSEFQRWGMHNLTEEAKFDLDKTQDAQAFLKQIELALQKDEMVLVRETDFDALRNYLAHQHKGQLHLYTGDVKNDPIEVTYSISKTGEYLLPWGGENIVELLANGKTYLVTDDDKVEFFYEIRELFYGDVKAFVACRPLSSVREQSPDPLSLTHGAPNGSDSDQAGPSD
jgi:hypothetical protein